MCPLLDYSVTDDAETLTSGNTTEGVLRGGYAGDLSPPTSVGEIAELAVAHPDFDDAERFAAGTDDNADLIEMGTDAEVGAAALALAGMWRGMITSILRTTTFFGPGVAHEMSSVTHAADDVISATAIVLWNNREVWWPRPAEEQRKYSCTIAKNQARQARAAACRRFDHLPSTSLDKDDSPPEHLYVTPEPTVRQSMPHRDGLFALKTRVIETYGEETWTYLVAAGGKDIATNIRDRIHRAITEIETTGTTDLSKLVEHHTSWQHWAEVRIETGRTLSTVDAARLGLFTTERQAAKSLTGWWVNHQTARYRPITIPALVAAGLTDHIPEKSRLRTASNLLAANAIELAA